MSDLFCEFIDPMTGRACGQPGRRLTLQSDFGRSLCVRTLCRKHSDWQEAPEAVAEHPLGLRDRVVLAEIGIRWEVTP